MLSMNRFPMNANWHTDCNRYADVGALKLIESIGILFASGLFCNKINKILVKEKWKVSIVRMVIFYSLNGKK